MFVVFWGGRRVIGPPDSTASTPTHGTPATRPPSAQAHAQGLDVASGQAVVLREQQGLSGQHRPVVRLLYVIVIRDCYTCVAFAAFATFARFARFAAFALDAILRV